MKTALLQYDLFYTVQAASRKITQISIDNHLEYHCEKVSKLRSKVKNVLKKSVPASSVLHTLLVVINCGNSDILKGKRVSLVKRFSNNFFQCLHSSPPASTRSLQLPFVYRALRRE